MNLMMENMKMLIVTIVKHRRKNLDFAAIAKYSHDHQAILQSD